MRASNTFFVGRSARTNNEGIAFLTEVAARDGATVIPVDVAQGLHLKSACSMLDETTVIIDPAVLSSETFAAHGLKTVEALEPLGANVLAYGDLVIASEAAPKTIELLKNLGYTLRTLCVDELHKGDGALSCLSMRIQPTGHWAV
jgi:dimethylargininase